MTRIKHSLTGDATGRRSRDARQAYIYAYGSLLSPELMRQACPSATFVLRADLPNYAVQFRVPSDTGLGGLSGIVESPGQLVHGVIYAVDKKEMPDLDALESVPEGIYEKRHFRVLGEDKEWYEVALYRPTNPGDELAPAAHYLDNMIAGARAHQLDLAYTAKLVAWRRSLD